MDRLKQRVGWARRALKGLHPYAIRKSPSIAQRDVAMLRFLLAVETTWKAAQALLKEREGRDEGSPKAVVRASREAGLLGEVDCERALDMVDDRNLVSHTYDEPLARGIFRRLGGHDALMDRWLAAMESRLTPVRRGRGRPRSVR